MSHLGSILFPGAGQNGGMFLAPGLVQDMNISPENWGSKTFYLKTTSTQVLQVLSEFFVGKKVINFETATCKSKGSTIFWWTFSHFLFGETNFWRFTVCISFLVEKRRDLPKQRNTQELLSEIHALGRQLSMKTAELEVSQVFFGTFWCGFSMAEKMSSFFLVKGK